MSRRNRHSLPFLVIAIVMVIGIDFTLFGEKPPMTGEQARQDLARLQKEAPEKEKPVFETEIMPPSAAGPVTAAPSAEIKKEEPAWKRYAVPADIPPGKPKITIIIDDLGADHVHTRDIIALPGPLTLSYLPYPPDVKTLVEEGRSAGHEIMMHMPMEPLEADLDSGAYVLRSGMDAETFEKTLLDNLGRFGGYVGINNHMGSRLTQDPEAMRMVMARLYDAGLLFIDSRTISSTIAEKTAADYGVPHAARDVFLDDDPSPATIAAQLAEVERIAREKGQAIAIGHPHGATIDALRAWLPTLAEKGFVLVPVSAVVETQNGPEVR